VHRGTFEQWYERWDDVTAMVFWVMASHILAHGYRLFDVVYFPFLHGRTMLSDDTVPHLKRLCYKSMQGSIYSVYFILGLSNLVKKHNT